MKKVKKEIKERLQRTCAICGKKIKVILYKDRNYRGGHYFGKIPFYSKKEEEKMSKSGTRKETINGFTINVINYEGKPYKYEEYWECPKCYWEGAPKNKKGQKI